MSGWCGAVIITFGVIIGCQSIITNKPCAFFSPKAGFNFAKILNSTYIFQYSYPYNGNGNSDNPAKIMNCAQAMLYAEGNIEACYPKNQTVDNSTKTANSSSHSNTTESSAKTTSKNYTTSNSTTAVNNSTSKTNINTVATTPVYNSTTNNSNKTKRSTSNSTVSNSTSNSTVGNSTSNSTVGNSTSTGNSTADSNDAGSNNTKCNVTIHMTDNNGNSYPLDFIQENLGWYAQIDFPDPDTGEVNERLRITWLDYDETYMVWAMCLIDPYETETLAVVMRRNAQVIDSGTLQKIESYLQSEYFDLSQRSDVATANCLVLQ